MPIQRFPAVLLIACAAALHASAAPPVPAFLAPEKYVAASGETLAVRIAPEARAARAAAWPETPVSWMLIRGGITQQNRHAVKPERAGDDFISIPLTNPGVTLLGVDHKPTVKEMTGAELRGFVEAHVKKQESRAKAAELAADAKLRVRHYSSAKTLVRVTGAGPYRDTSEIATSKTGQDAEMRPMFDPAAAQIGSDIPLVVYVEGERKKYVQIRATHVPSGDAITLTVEENGMTDLHVTATGLWRLEMHHAEPRSSDAAADWTVWSATLSFEIPATGAAAVAPATKGEGQ